MACRTLPENICCYAISSFFLFVGIIVVIALAGGTVTTRNAIRFSVTNATLAQFEISHNNTLSYDLALEMAVSKSGCTSKVKYYQIEANGYYGSQRLSNVTLNPFVQYAYYSNYDRPCSQPDYVNILRPVFKGQNTIILDATESARFNTEKVIMIYNILMEMQLRVRVVGGIGGNYKFRVRCGLKVPLTGTGGGATDFKYTKCKIRYSR
ncbi:unnamed protein product [Rhodiola kirilowii]